MTVDHAMLQSIVEPAIACARGFASRRAGLTVEEKTRGAGDFVSVADRAVEEVIRAALVKSFGSVALLGEEGGGSLDASGNGWVIDPIDGTTNFLRGLPLWGISIGYVEAGEPIAGVIALPDLDVTLSAVPGSGLWKNGSPLPPPAIPAAIRHIALGENDYERGQTTDARAQDWRAEGFSVVRYYCASFSLASAALGWTDGYIEHGCSLWDIAAGIVICREAGLAVTSAEIAPGRWMIDVRR